MTDILVEARIELLPPEKGGKANPVRAFYRPNHNFGDADDQSFDIGQIEIGEGALLSPGEVRNLVVRFIERPGLRSILVPDTKWRIQEAFRLVGFGTVLRVLS
jgi:hypothetical protein